MKETNNLTIRGRLTRDMEVAYTQTGFHVGKFAIANGKSWKSGAGEKKEQTSFFDCVLLGKGAEALAQYMTKGKLVLLTGSLKQERWEKDGESRSRVVIEVAEVDFLPSGGKKDQQEDQGSGYQSPTQERSFDDDIPF